MKKQRRFYWLIPLLCLVLAVLCAGCGGAEASQPQPTAEPQVTHAPTAEPSPTPDPDALFTLADYPRVDGSTANLPLMAQVMADTCGIPLEEAQSYVSASKTANSWRSLISGYADLLLVYEMPDAVKEEWEASGVELEITPIGRDALVFMVNEQNPVQSLTQEQIRSIYTGEVTNWVDVGGEDLEIKAFQRDATSGSQTLFVKLLMGDTPTMDAPTELRPGMMGALVDGLALYNNEGSAIGYSVYYYINEMYSQPGLRLLAVDGVTPSAESIANQSYPLLNEFYVAIRADEPEDSPARQLYNWVLGEGGRAAVEAGGYVPAAPLPGGDDPAVCSYPLK
ncbi:MAG: substrate-binding domain-containing protein [Oscillospiraceae bacterium]|nr:substrate-binding domain-containing protein [Oscillospiraceae bacterium]